MPFRRRYPDVRINIAEGLFPAIEADLQNGRMDFYVGPIAAASVTAQLIVEPLFEKASHFLPLRPSLGVLDVAERADRRKLGYGFAHAASRRRVSALV